MIFAGRSLPVWVNLVIMGTRQKHACAAPFTWRSQADLCRCLQTPAPSRPGSRDRSGSARLVGDPEDDDGTGSTGPAPPPKVAEGRGLPHAPAGRRLTHISHAECETAAGYRQTGDATGRPGTRWHTCRQIESAHGSTSESDSPGQGPLHALQSRPDLTISHDRAVSPPWKPSQTAAAARKSSTSGWTYFFFVKPTFVCPAHAARM